MTPRDGQRAAVYEAEQQWSRLLDRAADQPIIAIAGSRITLPAQRHVADISGAQRYVDAVLALREVRRSWPETAGRPVVVRERRGQRRAHYEFDTATIALPLGDARDRWALRETVLLHELTHHLGSSLGGGRDTGHGQAFTGRLVRLAEIVLGAEAAFLLRILLSDQGAAIA